MGLCGNFTFKLNKKVTLPHRLPWIIIVMLLHFSVRRQGIDVEGREKFGMVYKLGLRMYRLYVNIEGEYYYKKLNARLENELR